MDQDSATPRRTLALAESIAIMARLRAPGGCPWDREQTFDSIKRYTLEETYEVFDAIDRRAWPDLKDELGDLLLQVLFYAQMAEEQGYFSIEDVAANLNAKLIRRHPHIFAEAHAETATEVKATWEAIKQQERTSRGEAPKPYIEDVPRHIPALTEAFRLGQRASRIGFDWHDSMQLLEKLEEERQELREEMAREPRSTAELEGELGDLLFTAVNLARHLALEPEFALRQANRKFRARFNAMEAAHGIETLRAAAPAELEDFWQAAKRTVAASGSAADPGKVAELHPDSSLPG